MQINNIFALLKVEGRRKAPEKSSILHPAVKSVKTINNLSTSSPIKSTCFLMGKNKEGQSSIRYFSSVLELPASLFKKKTDVFVGRDYLTALEAAAPDGVEFRYTVVYTDGRPVGFFYFQIIPVFEKNTTRLVQPEPWHSLLKAILKLSTGILNPRRKLYVIIQGNACLSGPWFWHPAGEETGIPVQHLREVHAALLSEFQNKGSVLATVMKDLTQDHKQLLSFASRHRFLKLPMQPLMQMSIRPAWKTMGDYVSDLSNKYRKRFLQARSKLEACDIKTLTPEDLLIHQDQIDRLYSNVKEKAPVQLFQTDAAYLIALKENLGELLTVKGIWLEGRMIAFLTGIRSGAHYEAHHIGIDYHYNRSHSLYLNILFCYIDLAIASKSPMLSFGRTAMEMKTTVGAVPVYQDTYLKFSLRILNSLIRPFISSQPSEDWIPRDPFKK